MDCWILALKNADGDLNSWQSQPCVADLRQRSCLHTLEGLAVDSTFKKKFRYSDIAGAFK